jgi:hypothetical protein
MPRKQRFKPSRKPKPEQVAVAEQASVVSNSQVEDHKEIPQREAQDVERQSPPEQAPRSIENEGP